MISIVVYRLIRERQVQTSTDSDVEDCMILPYSLQTCFFNPSICSTIRYRKRTVPGFDPG